MQDTHAYVIKSWGSWFSMNDIIELCSYWIWIGVVLVIVGMFTESKSIKDFGIRIIVIVISPIVLFLAFALFGYIVNQFS